MTPFLEEPSARTQRMELVPSSMPPAFSMSQLTGMPVISV